MQQFIQRIYIEIIQHQPSPPLALVKLESTETIIFNEVIFIKPNWHIHINDYDDDDQRKKKKIFSYCRRSTATTTTKTRDGVFRDKEHFFAAPGKCAPCEFLMRIIFYCLFFSLTLSHSSAHNKNWPNKTSNSNVKWVSGKICVTATIERENWWFFDFYRGLNAGQKPEINLLLRDTVWKKRERRLWNFKRNNKRGKLIVNLLIAIGCKKNDKFW